VIHLPGHPVKKKQAVRWKELASNAPRNWLHDVPSREMGKRRSVCPRSEVEANENGGTLELVGVNGSGPFLPAVL